MMKSRVLFFYAALSILPHIYDIHVLYILSAYLLLAWAWAAKKWSFLMPSKWLLWAITLAAPIASFWQFKTLLGPESSTSLLLPLLGIKFFEVKSLRDQVIFLFLVMVVGIYRMVFSQDLMTLIYVSLLFVLFLYFVLQIRNPHVKATSEFRSLFKSKEFYISVPIVVAFFFLFPRFSTPFGRYLDEDRQTIGFSGDLRPGDLANLSASEEIAFRVNFRDDYVVQWQDLYFRGIVLDETDGFNWSQSKARASRIVSEDVEKVDYYISQSNRFGKVVFVNDGTEQLALNGRKTRLLQYADGTYKLAHDFRQSFVTEGRLGVTKSPVTEKDLQLPKSFAAKNSESMKFVSEMNQKLSFNNLLVELKKFFSNPSFVYTNSTPTYESLDQFLFGQRAGFCEHFASSLALLLRALKVPARVVTGFQGAEFNAYGSYYLVRDKYAHAWVEAYDGENWIRVDPTSWVSSIRVTMARGNVDINKSWWGIDGLQQMYYVLDGLNNRFALYLLTFDRDKQLNILADLGFKNASVKSLILLLVGSVISILALYFLFVRFRRPALPQSEKLRRHIEKELIRFNQYWPRHLGPIEFEHALQVESGEAHKAVEPLLRQYVHIKYERPEART